MTKYIFKKDLKHRRPFFIVGYLRGKEFWFCSSLYISSPLPMYGDSSFVLLWPLWPVTMITTYYKLSRACSSLSLASLRSLTKEKFVKNWICRLRLVCGMFIFTIGLKWVRTRAPFANGGNALVVSIAWTKVVKAMPSNMNWESNHSKMNWILTRNNVNTKMIWKLMNIFAFAAFDLTTRVRREK